MPARNPDEVDMLVQGALNSGNVDAIVELYEPDAAFAAQDGQVAASHDAIRATVKAFIDLKPQIDLKVEKTVPGWR